MRRSVTCLLLLATAATAAITAAGCGFGRADDTGPAIPGQYWGWVCPSGDAPDGDAGCPLVDGSAIEGHGDAGAAADGLAPNR